MYLLLSLFGIFQDPQRTMQKCDRVYPLNDSPRNLFAKIENQAWFLVNHKKACTYYNYNNYEEECEAKCFNITSHFFMTHPYGAPCKSKSLSSFRSARTT